MLEMHLEVKKKKGEAGYFIEELSSTQFTTYANVSSLAGVTQGNLVNANEGWLRFDDNGIELIISKKPVRNRISWDHLNSVGCVSGSRVITIQGNQYKVRLLKGADHDPTQFASPGYGHYLDGSHNSEWSRLFYPIVNDSTNLPVDVRNPNAPYTNSDLGMIWVDEATTPGSYCWCQERHSNHYTQRVARGYGGVSNLSRYTSSNAYAYHGWRACLELVS